MRKIHPQLTYANVVATLALFLALGGATAFAATQLAQELGRLPPAQVQSGDHRQDRQ